MSSHKKLAILGSTGSIGTQALEVVEAFPHLFKVEVLTAYSKAKLLVAQAEKFRPSVVVIGDIAAFDFVKSSLAIFGIKVLVGEEALEEVVENKEVDMVLTALVGFAGLKPTIKAIEAKKPIALANKETLVVAGALINELAQKNEVPILPVDSEHSALFQCLVGEENNPIEKIYLTASGGPFRGYSYEALQSVTPAQALKHPNWEMGAKITIDSASMMNKGLEVIEAKWLFKLKPEQIEVVVHPQSIIHSIVQFQDGSMKAQMGLPDMKLPIQYALGYPERLPNSFPRFNFFDYPSLTFEMVDTNVFKNLDLAYRAMELGGNMACVLNASNEETNRLFRQNKISFTDMGNLNQEAMAKITFIQNPNLDDLIQSDSLTRDWVNSQLTLS